MLHSMVGAQSTILVHIFESKQYDLYLLQGAELEFDIFVVLDGREVRFVMEPVRSYGGLATVEDLFSQLIPMIFALGFAYLWYKVNTSAHISPFKASLFYFLTGIVFILGMFLDTAETPRIFCGAFGSHFIFVAAVHLITNDSETYQREASVLVMGLTALIMGTGVLMLAMDYSNTKSVLNPLIIGFVSGFLGVVLDPRRNPGQKEVNL